MNKSLDDYQDDELVLDFANIKMTKKEFNDWYDNIEVPICPCSVPDRDERIFKDKDFWEVAEEGANELSKDEEAMKTLRKVILNC